MTGTTDKLLSSRQAGTLIVTLNDPERRNPISTAVRKALSEAFDAAARDVSLKAIVLCGAGGNFSAGGDISEMGQSVNDKRAQFTIQKGIINQIYFSPVPVIAAVDGWAAGAGFSLALLADTIVAAKDAKFVASFPKVGLIPDYAMLHTLPNRVGHGRARNIMMYAKPLDAESGADIGLVDHLCESGKALESALELAKDLELIAPKPLRAIKEYEQGGLDRALDFERLLQPDLLQSEDAKEGRLAFREKRLPKFTDN